MTSIAGVLHKLGGGMFEVWQRRFFAPDSDSGELLYYDGDDALSPDKLKGRLPLRHVEVVDRGSMFGKHTFSILTKDGRKGGKEYFLAAATNEEKSQWLFALMALSGLYLRLFDPSGPAGPAELEAGDTADDAAANAARIAKSPLFAKCIGAPGAEANRQCADCGAPNPTWAVHNEPFGVFVCIDCIGVHRALWAGNCREIQLDAWPEADVARMASLGNARADAELEYHVPAGVVKPTQHSARDVRAAFIAAKYRELAFSRHKCAARDLPPLRCAARDTDARPSAARSGPGAGPPRYTGVVYLRFASVAGVDVSKCCVIIANGFQSAASTVPANTWHDGRTDVSVVQAAFPLDTLRRPLFVSFTDANKIKVRATAVILGAVSLRNVPEGNEVSASWTLIMPSDAKDSAAPPTLTGTIKFETLA